jgi:hypothetical protein
VRHSASPLNHSRSCSPSLHESSREESHQQELREVLDENVKIKTTLEVSVSVLNFFLTNSDLTLFSSSLLGDLPAFFLLCLSLNLKNERVELKLCKKTIADLKEDLDKSDSIHERLAGGSDGER